MSFVCRFHLSLVLFKICWSFQCLGEINYRNFHKVQTCRRSTAQIISSANFRSLERCVEFARGRNALAINFSPPEAERFRKSDGRDYFTNCQILTCPESNYRNLENDSAYDYYSVYGNLTNLEDTACVKSIGLFRLFKDKQNYTNAITKCQEIDGDLANVVSEKRTNSLALLLSNQIDVWSKAAYVGLDDTDVEGKFMATSGDLLTCYRYRAWAPGHPRSKHKNEDCVILDSEKTWKVVKCKDSFPFLCEVYPMAPNKIASDGDCDRVLDKST